MYCYRKGSQSAKQAPVNVDKTVDDLSKKMSSSTLSTAQSTSVGKNKYFVSDCQI